ncbi:GNAT family N-acetyltransferase [Leekyejoonella antrihumi]|uniref:GNAT family N-acetyltransferase n=1 Tax=Leekyejoonella antrihumi TaxID=1660198 RepID=A0A563E513_9MICO|nr:GNAT family N-acetyltransferase [Leekyejoonella antrihumi]TWP37648.1 GNAT family N-acetyltransferase [Leekyejoonella antrihumi]
MSGDQTPSVVTTRTATGDDLHAVLEVGHRTWPPTYVPIAGKDYVAMGLAKWWTADATIPPIRAGRVTVAELEGDVVGVAVVGPLDGALALWKLYVMPECQGHGVGARLMRAVIDKALADGYDQVVLSHLAGNVGAAAFYKKFGFEFVRQEEGGSGMPDNVWLRLQLGGKK